MILLPAVSSSAYTAEESFPACTGMKSLPFALRSSAELAACRSEALLHGRSRKLPQE
jgi:hypothetical protein